MHVICGLFPKDVFSLPGQKVGVHDWVAHFFLFATANVTFANSSQLFFFVLFLLVLGSAFLLFPIGIIDLIKVLFFLRSVVIKTCRERVHQCFSLLCCHLV